MLRNHNADLLKIIQHQEESIAKQNELIAKLANENAEQENLINIMMKERID